MGPEVEQLLIMVEERRPDDAMALVRGLVADGWSASQVIADLLGPVQLEVGQLWEADRWTVAQEHAASGVVQAALGVLANLLQVPAPRGEAVVACVEHEWHSISTRMLNEQLRIRGFRTMFLGASTPSDALYSYVADHDVAGVVLSCQMAMALPGAARAVRAVHDAGLPVVIGGAALGVDPLRGRNLGADAWCADLDQLDALLVGWAADPPEELAAPRSDDGEHLVVLSRAPDAVLKVGASLSGVLPNPAETVDHLVRFLAAAVLVDDPRIIDEHLAWLRRVIAARGGHAMLAEELVLDVLDVLPSEAATAARFGRAAVESTARS